MSPEIPTPTRLAPYKHRLSPKTPKWAQTVIRIPWQTGPSVRPRRGRFRPGLKNPPHKVPNARGAARCWPRPDSARTSSHRTGTRVHLVSTVQELPKIGPPATICRCGRAMWRFSVEAPRQNLLPRPNGGLAGSRNRGEKCDEDAPQAVNNRPQRADRLSPPLRVIRKKSRAYRLRSSKSDETPPTPLDFSISMNPRAPAELARGCDRAWR